ncbi:hypothetical protein K0T92_24495, partial [Paenibacillus oenotherae]|nr:hypothetical protein [Paenibacillus oenotherae]
LSRYYDSSSSNVYDKEVSFGLFCSCIIEYDAISYTERYNDNTGELTRVANYGGTFHFTADSPLDRTTMTNTYYVERWLGYIIGRAGQVAFANDWSAPNSNGIRTRTVQEIKTNHNAKMSVQVIDPGNGGIIWTNVATNTPYQERLYPLGTGWSWDIPYIKMERGNKQYLNMGSRGTYQIVGNSLKGYQWKDLTVEYDTSVLVDNVRSIRVLKSLDGNKQHFADDGRLIQISDAYQNTIQFKYAQHAKYGKVLTSITDAIGNAINIAYDNTGITLTQGDKVIRYDKGTQQRMNPRPPFDVLKSEYLSQVTDPIGRVTQYQYQEGNAKFNLTYTNPSEENRYLLLNRIIYPTGATSSYTYQDTATTRALGSNAAEEAYRITSRVDRGNGIDYNRLDFTYNSDVGST